MSFLYFKYEENMESTNTKYMIKWIILSRYLISNTETLFNCFPERILAVSINAFGFITGVAALWYVSSEDIKGAYNKFKSELKDTQKNTKK